MKFFLFLCLVPLLATAEPKNWLKPFTLPGEIIPINLKDVEILRRASEILRDETKWNRRDNRECPKNAVKFSLYCALFKASVEINGEFDHRLGAMEELRASIETASKGKVYEHRLMGYNNDPSTSLKDIKNVLDVTAKRIAERLERTH